ncbi:unnamed protein product [Ixodes pacificus]
MLIVCMPKLHRDKPIVSSKQMENNPRRPQHKASNYKDIAGHGWRTRMGSALTGMSTCSTHC